MDVMSLRDALREVMLRENLSVINVASACDVDAITVKRFLEGDGTPHRLTVRAFQGFVASKSKVSPEEPKTATG